MTVDVTKPLEVVALAGADEPEGTCWDAEYVCLTYSGNILTRTKAPRWMFKPTGEHSYGYPYRLRNKRAVIDLRTHPKDQLELEHIETGERVPCEASVYWPDEASVYCLSGETPDEYRWFNADGTQIGCCSKWRIVAKRTEWWEREDVRDRVVEFLGGMAALDMTGEGGAVENDYAEARALLAEIEASSKDALVEEIREQLGPKFKHLAPLVAEEHRKQLAKEGDAQ